MPGALLVVAGAIVLSVVLALASLPVALLLSARSISRSPIRRIASARWVARGAMSRNFL